MITDKKNVLRVTSFAVVSLLLIFVLIFSMSSCSVFKKGDFNYDHVFDGVSVFSSTVATTVPEYKYYDVIVSSKCSAEVYEAADELCKRIEAKTSLKADVYYDYELTIRDNGHFFILIGVLDNDICRRAYLDFRSDDYRYSFMNGVFVVGGVTDSATLMAIDRFAQDVVDSSKDMLVMSDPEGFLYKAEYTDSKEVTLNGFSLSQYRIVYPVGDTDGMLLADKLNDDIEKRFGYTLSVMSDSEGEADSRSICIGRTLRADTYGLTCSATQSVILPYSTGVSVIADSLFGLKVGIAEFFDIIDDPECVDIEIKDKITAEYNMGAGSVANFYFIESELNVQKILSICDAIRNCDSDIMRFEGISAVFFDYVRRNLSNTFNDIEIASPDGVSVYYLYKKGNLTTEISEIETDGSSLSMVDAKILRNGLEFTVAQLYSGEDAFELGEKLFLAGVDNLVVFGDHISYENNFISGSKILRKCQDDDLILNVFVNNESVSLKKADCSKNALFECTKLEFMFFYE